MISIVIVNWNSGSLLGNCIRSLLQNARGCQIVIVDNASTDSSLDFAADIRLDATIIRNSENMGFAAACNRGWQASAGRFVLFLNPDTECCPDSISYLEQTLTADKTVCAVGGRLIGESGRLQVGFNVRPFPSIWRVAAETFFIDEVLPVRSRYGSAAGGPSPVAFDVDQPAAACLMVPKTVLETLGGFDEAFYPAWFEDVDLCRRIHHRGGRIQYQPAARFLHHGGYSLSKLSRQSFLEYFHTNQIRYFRKHLGWHAAQRVRRLAILGLRLRSALSIFYPLAPNASRMSSVKIFWNAARRIPKVHEVGT
jgi:N-acetylglucosaminyl-diphospho-decaprenol L-rhamnosyltransferase